MRPLLRGHLQFRVQQPRLVCYQSRGNGGGCLRNKQAGGGAMLRSRPGIAAADGSLTLKHAPACQCSIRGVAFTYLHLQQEKQPLLQHKNDCWNFIQDTCGHCVYMLIKRSPWKLNVPAVLSYLKSGKKIKNSLQQDSPNGSCLLPRQKRLQPFNQRLHSISTTKTYFYVGILYLHRTRQRPHNSAPHCGCRQ